MNTVQFKAAFSRITVLGAVAFSTAGLALAGCGGSSSSKSAATAPAGSAPAAAQTPAGTARGSGHGQADTAQTGKAVIAGQPVQRARSRGGDEPLPIAPRGPNPCMLVSRTQAQAILGAPIQSVTEAPLGPTCIFKLQGQEQTVTLAVERMNIASQVHVMKKVQRSTVGGHAAYCGTLGRPMLYLSLSRGRVLNVTAPCGIAQALAAKALPRITA